MKKIFNFLLFSFAITFFYSCSNEDKIIDQVSDGLTSGVILKKLEKDTDSPSFVFPITTSSWETTVELRGTNEKNRLKEVKLYVKYTTNGVSSAEVFVKTFPASIFAPADPYGLPNAKLSATLAETLAALSVSSSTLKTSDKFAFRTEIVLEDGRTYSNTNASPSISQSFFNSNFAYSVQFRCPISDASIFNGNYKVVTDAYQDYVAGDIVPVVYNAANGTMKFRILNTNNPGLINGASTYYEVTVNLTTEKCTVVGNAPFNYGGGFLTNATGTGRVGTCTGDINLSLNFSGSSQKQAFSLVKF